MADPDSTQATVRYTMPAQPGAVGTQEVESPLTSARRNSLADAAAIIYTAVWTPQVSNGSNGYVQLVDVCEYKHCACSCM
jgi:hypothetical protein